MTQQFTASEVRAESCKQGQLHRQPASDMLNVLADMLEADEKAMPVAWIRGYPQKPWSEEWFIAETTYGDRVVLRALPEEYTYDFKTADETYIKRGKIARWMQFPDSEFIAPPAGAERLAEALREIKERMEYQQLTPLVAAIIHKCDEAIAAHSAQAQPPAAVEQSDWPEELMLRDTGIHDDQGGLGQRIFTTAGAGYKKVKYVRADLLDAKGCVWSEDEDGNWDTGCGNMFVFTEGTPYDNEMGFCCYCGGNLDQVTRADAAMEQESGR